MKIDLREIPIQEVVRYSPHLKKCQGYEDKGEEGVYGIGGRLNIRPPYQREFIYKDKQRDAVIDTLINNFPLNVMYWVVNKDGSYEVLDGQQRLISICQFVSEPGFSFNGLFFHNFTEDQKAKLLDYKLMVYFCDGAESEKLNWFRTINIAGEKLTDQELRNAVYAGPWVNNAKRYFSKSTGPAHKIADRFLKGSAIRQDYLETVIKWISGGDIEEYMAVHQHDEDAKELWAYFENVIGWVNAVFTNYKKEMKGVPFGLLYNQYKDGNFDPAEIENLINSLMQDEDVTKKAGIYIYTYIFTGNERELSIRSFTENNKREAYERQGGICIHCKEHFEIDAMEADHITPWSKGGKTISDNCQMLCLRCNRTKGDV